MLRNKIIVASIVISLLVLVGNMFNNLNPTPITYKVKVINQTCLDKYSLIYCNLEPNFKEPTLANDDYFYCILRNHDRVRTNELSNRFYYLENELINCTYQINYSEKDDY